ncbi:MAG: FHA domain-containing protein [Planctomycetes bacterium]|nr:FHA domain-containing protein [Planctomycetota bacterium]
MLLRSERTGISYKLGKRTLIGRATTSDVDVSIADESVSRCHAEIIREPEGFFIRDIDSKNGTFLNDKKITSSTVIAPGDTVRIGKVAFSVESPERSPKDGGDLATEDLIYDGKDGATVANLTRVGVDAKTLCVTEGGRKKGAQPSKPLLERLQLIADLTSAIRGASGLEEIEHNMAGQMLATFPTAKRCIIVLRGQRGKLMVRAVVSRPKDSSASVRISRTIINHVLTESRSVLCADAMSEDQYAGAKSVRAMNIHSFMCAPLLGSEKPFGVVFLDTIDHSQQFSGEDLALLTVAANQAALALEKAQLIEQLDIDRDRLSEENRRLRNTDAVKCDFENIVHVSRKMKDVLDLTQKIALVESPVLILGDRGTGKELIAHAVHFNSPRRDKPFEILNCAAITEQLVQSELFGHEKGAFTDAKTAKPGLFEIANHGTLFLDEVGDLPLETQAKLLRATEYGQFRRVGGTKDIEVDVRLVAATNKDLKKEADEGRFRADLYDRLNVAVINLPPLSKRREDILPLANHFVSELARKMSRRVTGLSNEAISLLRRYNWPGNVRELRNVIEKAMIQVTDDVIDVADLPVDIREAGSSAEKYKRIGRLAEAEAALKFDMITDALRETDGNKSKAAELLGISRAGLRKMMDALGME